MKKNEARKQLVSARQQYNAAVVGKAPASIIQELKGKFVSAILAEIIAYDALEDRAEYLPEDLQHMYSISSEISVLLHEQILRAMQSEAR